MNWTIIIVAIIVSVTIMTSLVIHGASKQPVPANTYVNLVDYTDWLAGKGALRDGFGEDQLVSDFLRYKS